VSVLLGRWGEKRNPKSEWARRGGRKIPILSGGAGKDGACDGLHLQGGSSAQFAFVFSGTFLTLGLGRSLVRSGLLALLQLLLLLGVFLRQLFGLLLMLLLQGLLFRLVCRRLREPRMILLLLGLEFLALIDLLDLKLLLLLLIFLVLLGVASVWSGEVFHGWKFLGVDRGARPSGLGGRAGGFVGCARSFGVRASWLGARAGVLGGGGGMNRATFFGGYGSAVFEGTRLGGSSDGRLAVIGGGT
jgi:hypothetical protein